MRVCVLSDETFGDYTPESILVNHEWKMFYVKRPAFDFIRDVALSEPFDVYLNLCDGSEDEDRPGVDVIQALEALNLPFTGADSGFYAMGREQTYLIAERKSIGFPRGVHARAQENIETKIAKVGLRFPLIVKHHDSYASVGMTRDSRVETMEQLRVQFEKMCAQYGSARVEEFIDGREFTILVADNPDNLDDPHVYHPLEIIFPPTETFKHWAMKFDLEAGADMDLAQVSEPALLKRLKGMARKIYLGMGGMGYARADIRMNQEGELFLLELNANPSVLNVGDQMASADYMMEYDAGGVDGFLDRIFRSAIVRREKRMLPPSITRRRKLEPAEVRR